jgi:hypothetical protein
MDGSSSITKIRTMVFTFSNFVSVHALLLLSKGCAKEAEKRKRMAGFSGGAVLAACGSQRRQFGP